MRRWNIRLKDREGIKRKEERHKRKVRKEKDKGRRQKEQKLEEE